MISASLDSFRMSLVDAFVRVGDVKALQALGATFSLCTMTTGPGEMYIRDSQGFIRLMSTSTPDEQRILAALFQVAPVPEPLIDDILEIQPQMDALQIQPRALIQPWIQTIAEDELNLELNAIQLLRQEQRMQKQQQERNSCMQNGLIVSKAVGFFHK